MGEEEGKELTSLLEDAADGRPGALSAFFECLLRAELHVSRLPRPGEAEQFAMPPGANLQVGEHGYVTVNYDGRECLLMFTEPQFAAEWAGGELPTEAKPLSALLWLVGDESWMYINPSQEVGKELTAWEIQQLRKGPEAIPELVAALSDEPFGDFEIRTGNDLFPELKRKILSVLEVAKNLEEAFLVAVREEGSQSEKPLLGLKYGPVDPSIRQYIRSEIEETVKALPELGDGTGQIIIVDDLGEDSSPNHGIFEDAVPFFLAEGFEKPTIMSKTKSAMRDALQSIFGMGKAVPNEPEDDAKILQIEEEE